MATPTPAPVKSTPRKLPIKRKTPSNSNSSDPSPTPSFPSDPLLPVKADPDLAAGDDGFDEEEEEYDEEDGEEEAPVDLGVTGAPVANFGVVGDGGGPGRSPPFKFHRIWSESDEIRFLQGLLGCWSQGMVFPRDLNLFYDRFSESMPQPYTRSQLSEKLRRLRKKFRVMSARIARGQDPSRLAPHDRDLLHLCTRLWHPSYAASSPFSPPDSATAHSSAGGSASAGNKRRRPNPRTPSGRAPTAADSLPPAQLTPSSPLSLPAPPPLPLPMVASTPLPPPAEEKPCAMEANQTDSEPVILKEEDPQAVSSNGEASKEEPKRLVVKAVLDVFDTCLKEVRATLAGQGLLPADCVLVPGAADKSDLEKRWREQRSAEMNVLARRLRLVLESSAQN